MVTVTWDSQKRAVESMTLGMKMMKKSWRRWRWSRKIKDCYFGILPLISETTPMSETIPARPDLFFTSLLSPSPNVSFIANTYSVATEADALLKASSVFITWALLSDAFSWVFLQLHRKIHHLDGSMAPRPLHHPWSILLLSTGCRGWGACRCLGEKSARSRRAWMRERKTITMGHLVGLPKLPCRSWFINPFPLKFNSITPYQTNIGRDISLASRKFALPEIYHYRSRISGEKVGSSTF